MVKLKLNGEPKINVGRPREYPKGVKTKELRRFVPEEHYNTLYKQLDALISVVKYELNNKN